MRYRTSHLKLGLGPSIGVTSVFLFFRAITCASSYHRSAFDVRKPEAGKVKRPHPGELMTRVETCLGSPQLDPASFIAFANELVDPPLKVAHAIVAEWGDQPMGYQIREHSEQNGNRHELTKPDDIRPRTGFGINHAGKTTKMTARAAMPAAIACSIWFLASRSSSLHWSSSSSRTVRRLSRPSPS